LGLPAGVLRRPISTLRGARRSSYLGHTFGFPDPRRAAECRADRDAPMGPGPVPLRTARPAAHAAGGTCFVWLAVAVLEADGKVSFFTSTSESGGAPETGLSA
jgi:hypothetical protein